VGQDPYRVFVYTSLQERATQVSHANTGKFASEYEPTIGTVLQNVRRRKRGTTRSIARCSRR